jgi:hypothetical protein
VGSREAVEQCMRELAGVALDMERTFRTWSIDFIQYLGYG